MSASKAWCSSIASSTSERSVRFEPLRRQHQVGDIGRGVDDERAVRRQQQVPVGAAAPVGQPELGDEGRGLQPSTAICHRGPGRRRPRCRSRARSSRTRPANLRPTCRRSAPGSGRPRSGRPAADASPRTSGPGRRTPAERIAILRRGLRPQGKHDHQNGPPKARHPKSISTANSPRADRRLAHRSTITAWAARFLSNSADGAARPRARRRQPIAPVARAKSTQPAMCALEHRAPPPPRRGRARSRAARRCSPAATSPRKQKATIR